MQLLVEEAISQELTVDNKEIAGVTISRDDKTMLAEQFDQIPNLEVGKVLIDRDLSTVDAPDFYSVDLPFDISTKKRVLLLDTSCATGGSAAMCIQKLIDSGVKEELITFVTIFSCEVGV